MDTGVTGEPATVALMSVARAYGKGKVKATAPVDGAVVLIPIMLIS
jgi:hypothetical protein